MRDSENFMGEIEVMDLSSLRDKQFLVAIATGQSDRPSFLPSTIRGPFTFFGMVEFVGKTWRDRTLKCRAIIPAMDIEDKNEYLDDCTIDYIEAHYESILMEGLLTGFFDADKEYTCSAETVKVDANGEVVEDEGVQQESSPG